jgi:transposase
MDRRKPVNLTQKEQQRLHVVMEVDAGRWSAEQAAEVLGVAVRHVWRLKARYRADGAAAFMHGNRGRSSQHRLSDRLRQQVLDLSCGPYADCNDSHFSEMLLLHHGIILSRASIQRIRRQAGLKPKQRRRPPRHRSRRDRRSQEGMLLQVDGSPHCWFGSDRPACSLLAGIDDATGRVPAALFREQEDAHGYFLLVRRVLTSHGLPLELYHDRHSIFQPNTRSPLRLDEQLQGRREPTQFSRALEELGITPVVAHSPEAKGRIERLWRSFQDRLTFELRLAGIRDIKAANRFLPAFLKRYNARFAVQPEAPGVVYRPLDPELDLDRVLSFRYQRVVARDNTVRLDGRVIQIPPGPRRRSYFAARVWVHELMDGSLGVRYGDDWLVRTSGRGDSPVVRARKRARAKPERAPAPKQLALPAESNNPVRTPWKPPHDHPWRRPFTPRGLTESRSS